MSAQWLDIIERSLGCTLSADSISKVSLSQFSKLISELAVHHNSAGQAGLPARTASQLRPRLDGPGVWRAVSGVKTAAPKPLQAMLKSMLLLADSVALQDPL